MRNFFILAATAVVSFSIGFFGRNNSLTRSADEDSQHEINDLRSAASIKTAALINMADINFSNKENMKLGAFSVSLSVKDINVSKAFYENLGFTVFAGSLERKYLIMKNETTLIGIFQGMFEGNMLTFNPGWDHNAKNIEQFDDIRQIQKELKAKGIVLNPEADEKTKGPASFIVKDPDGNVLLFDQHR